MGSMRSDASGLEMLSRQECLKLLASVSLGRIVFTDQALPAVQPIAFVLDGEDVVIHPRAGSKLDTALRRAVVAFEADELDPECRSGWSVTVIGQARPVAEDREAARLSALPLPSWDEGRPGLFIRIPSTYVSGRRIEAGAWAA